MLSNPTYGTTSDGYARSSMAAYRIAAFIRSLGYAARAHTPYNGYDVMVPANCSGCRSGPAGSLCVHDHTRIRIQQSFCSSYYKYAAGT